MMMRALAMAILGLVFGAAAAQAQSFPNRAVRIIVPYPAGGSVDNISRAVAPRLSAIWGQPIVIENRAGGATQSRRTWSPSPAGRLHAVRDRNGDLRDQSVHAVQAVL